MEKKTFNFYSPSNLQRKTLVLNSLHMYNMMYLRGVENIEFKQYQCILHFTCFYGKDIKDNITIVHQHAQPSKHNQCSETISLVMAAVSKVLILSFVWILLCQWFKLASCLMAQPFNTILTIWQNSYHGKELSLQIMDNMIWHNSSSSFYYFIPVCTSRSKRSCSQPTLEMSQKENIRCKWQQQ